MKRKIRYLTPWERFKVRKKYRQLMIFFVSVMSVFLIIALYLLYISGVYDNICKSVYNFLGITEFSMVADDYPLSVHFIDVGNGDAILIHTDSVNIMIDSGEYTLKGRSAGYLQHFGVENIDLFIATHSDSDHIGDFSHISDKCEIDRIWVSEYAPSENESSTEDEKLLYKTAKDKNIHIQRPKTGKYKIGDMTVDVLSPNKQFGNDNDNSLIVKISYQNISMLFTGDAGKAAEKELLDKSTDVSADILKVAHHGSKTATTEKFLDAVSPKYAIISVGNDNKYLPDRYTIERISNSGAEICRTDLDGSVIIASDGKNIEVFKENTQ